MNDEIDDMPVLVITDTSGMIIRIGDPEFFTEEELGEYAKSGHKLETMKLKDYQQLPKKLYEK